MPACSGTACTDPFSQQGSRSRRIARGLSRKANQASPRKGNQSGFAAQGRFLLQKTFVTTIHQVSDHWVVRAVGLNQHLTGLLRAPSPASELKQKLQALLSSPQIGSMQKTIGGKHCCQSHAWQVHPLGQHLRSDQHIGLTLRKLVQQSAVTITTTCGVAIKPQQTQITEFLAKTLQNPLCACTKGLEGQGTA